MSRPQKALRAIIARSLRRQRCGPQWRAQCADVLAGDGAEPSRVDAMAACAAVDLGQHLRRLLIAAGVQP